MRAELDAGNVVESSRWLIPMYWMGLAEPRSKRSEVVPAPLLSQ